MPLRLRRGTNTQRLGILPAEGELIYTTDTKNLYVGDGTTIGGVSVTTLASGMIGNFSGDVNLNTHSLVGIGDINILGNISASGQISGAYSGSFYANDSSLLIDAETGTIVGPYRNSISNVKITGGTSGQIITTDGSGNLSFTTLNTNNIPSVTNNNGKFLATDGTTIFWDRVSTQGDLVGSVYGLDSTLLVDGTNSIVSNGTLKLRSKYIESTTGNIEMGSTSYSFRNLILNCNISDPSPFQIRSIAAASGSISTPRMWFETYGTNISRSTNTLLTAGQTIGGMAFRVVNPTSNGGQIVPAGGIDFVIDETGSVNSAYATGKMVVATINGVNSLTDYHTLTFDRRGRLAVNKYTADEALDVAGNGKFSGFVQFGSLTTTERDALTAQNGMVIYNSSVDKFQGRQDGAWINLDGTP
jgi:hypothetical protein